jgi:hypothetical protein
MKKIWLFALTGLVLGMISCSKDEEDKEDPASEDFNFGGHSYLIVKQKKNWVAASADAVSRGGYLVEIGSKAEQDAVWQAIRQSGISTGYTQVPDGGGAAYIWIGANDGTTEGGWIWNGANKSGNIPLFWLGNHTGSAVAGSYVNWGGTSKESLNEPDDYTHTTHSPNGQDAAAIGLTEWPSGSSSPLGIAGEWNDIAVTNEIYYVVEFDSAP